MADNDNEITSVVPGARTPLSESMKKLANGIRMYMRKPYTEEIGGEVEVHEAVKDGVVTGTYVKKDDKVIETMSTPDAQQSGDDKKQAKAAGVKEDQTTATAATMVAKRMSEGKDSDWGKGAHEAGATSDNQADTPHEPEETKKADLGKGKTKEVKPKDPKEGSKPDNSMSKMASMKSGPTQGSESMEKSNYDIKREGDTLTYTKQKPAEGQTNAEAGIEPNWKKNWRAKSSADKQAFQQKLATQRQTIGKAPTPPKPSTLKPPMVKSEGDTGQYGPMMRFARTFKLHCEKLAKLDENMGEMSSNVQQMEKNSDDRRAQMAETAKKMNAAQANPSGESLEQMAARTSAPSKDQKIQAAVAKQNKPKLALVKADEPKALDGMRALMHMVGGKASGRVEVQPHPEEVDQNVDPKIIDNMKSRLANEKPGKPELVREMMRMKTHTSSGRPFRIMAATHPDHKKLAGEHHTLEAPMNPKQMNEELKKPTSQLSRKVLDAIDGGHDIMYVHQPEKQPMQKNAAVGYPEQGIPPQGAFQQKPAPMAMSEGDWSPTPHTSRPEKMNQSEGRFRKAPKRTHTRGETRAKAINDSLKKSNHQQYAANLLGRVKAWSAGKKQRQTAAKQDAVAVQQALVNGPAPLDKTGAPQNPSAPKTPGAPQPKHNPKIRAIADDYASKVGIKLNHNIPVQPINEERAGKIAQAYHAMPHNPKDPATQKAYGALVNETKAQFDHMMQHGVKISKITPDMANPYKTSQDLHDDVAKNNHIWYYPTESGFGSEGSDSSDHPLLQKVPDHEGKPMVANDMFRIVHDYFGHSKEGNGFGPKGEEAAWRHHMQMYSPDAQRALTSETRGQNSWVNFGPHAEHNRANPGQTKYADQKAGLLPDWAMDQK